MSGQCTAVIIGGTSGIGRQVAQVLAARGEDVIVTGRDNARAQSVAAGIGGQARGLAVDLAHPDQIAGALRDVGQVHHLVIAAISRDDNSVRQYDVARAMSLITLKLVGYTEAIRPLTPRLSAQASIVLFGGQAKERPYPGSTTVTTVNGAVTSLVRTLAVELAPVRVNALHPGIVGDSPEWSRRPAEVLDRVRLRTPTGRLVTMCDVAGAVVFLLDNQSVNGVNLNIDGGWMLL